MMSWLTVMVPWTGLFLLSLLFRERPCVLLLWDPPRVHSWSPLVPHVYAPLQAKLCIDTTSISICRWYSVILLKAGFSGASCIIPCLAGFKTVHKLSKTESVSWAEVIVIITLTGPSSNNISNYPPVLVPDQIMSRKRPEIEVSSLIQGCPLTPRWPKSRRFVLHNWDWSPS